MAVRSPATKRSKRTRAELARAAHDEIAKQGTVDPVAIAKAAGVSPATFYSHFATHDDAVAAALDISLTNVIAVAERLFHLDALMEQGLEVVMHSLISEMQSVFRSESLVLRTAQARMSSHRLSREVYRGHEARSVEYLTEQIELGQKAGIFRDGPSDKRATSLLILLQGLHNPLMTKKKIDEVVAADLERAAHALLAK